MDFQLWPQIPDSRNYYKRRKVKGLVAQSCLTLCDSMDYSLPGSSVHGILQARVLEWVAIPSSRRSSQPGTEPGSPALQADFFPSEPPGKPIKRELKLKPKKLKIPPKYSSLSSHLCSNQRSGNRWAGRSAHAYILFLLPCPYLLEMYLHSELFKGSSMTDNKHSLRVHGSFPGWEDDWAASWGLGRIQVQKGGKSFIEMQTAQVKSPNGK